jgi:uncharacterized protein YndB with AHSA1/START domain
MINMIDMPALSHHLERTVFIGAAPEVVFRFLTETPRWAAWWGAGSTIDARPGGSLLIRYPNGVQVAGAVVEVQPPRRMVFTYGYASGKPIPPGSSRVTIELERDRDGTRVHLVHEFAEAAVRDEHIQGWCYQLSLFGNVVADEIHAGAPAAIDGWFDAWAEADAAARQQTLARIADADVAFRDRFSSIDGLADLVPHIGAAQRFMPGIRMRRSGDVRQCQGTAIADWVALAKDGQERARGLNVFIFGANGRIRSVTGFMTTTR